MTSRGASAQSIEKKIPLMRAKRELLIRVHRKSSSSHLIICFISSARASAARFFHC